MSHTFTKWDVWLARVAFEDEPNTRKTRPVLIAGDCMFVVGAYKMTSHVPRDDNEYLLVDFIAVGLRVPTTIRLSKYLSLGQSDMIKRLGRVSMRDAMAIQGMLKRIDRHNRKL
ncbi:hypothetical protein FACS1894184_16980 [Clostridia bacterium]|nr:hypothetical protein FACS1894184_16980 [Clostridia bacterium]